MVVPVQGSNGFVSMDPDYLSNRFRPFFLVILYKDNEIDLQNVFYKSTIRKMCLIFLQG